MDYHEFLHETQAYSEAQEREVLETIQEVIDLHFSLFKNPGQLNHTSDNKLQRAWLALTTSAFHSARVALFALQSGYYTQSFMLTRAVYEAWLVASDCEEHTQTIEALFDSKIRMANFTTMADRLPDNLKGVWYGDGEGRYGFLSTFAHPRHRAAEDTVSHNGMLRIVPRYDEIRFALAAHYILGATLLMLEFVEKLADYLATPESQEWKVEELARVRPKSIELLALIGNRLTSYLE